MPILPGPLWLFEATGVAGEQCRYPTDSKHGLLVFAKADNREAAFTVAHEGAAAHGWVGVEMIRSGELPAGEIGFDEEMLHAAMNAHKSGCSLVVHDLPE